MKSYTHIYIFIIISILLYSCRYNKIKKQEIFIEQYKFESFNYCSQDLLFDDDIFGNTMIAVTSNNNFLKCSVINDTVYTFSCGRGKKEVTLLSKVRCELIGTKLGFDGLSMPKLIYDDDDIMILSLKGGSDSWMNYFVYLSKNIVFHEQALYIDYENRKYIYLHINGSKKGVVNFIIHDIMNNVRDTVDLNYSKFRNNGDPALNIKDVLLRNDTLFYSIDDVPFQKMVIK